MEAYQGCCCCCCWTRLLSREASRLLAMLAMLVSGSRFSALTGRSGAAAGDIEEFVTRALGEASERCRLLREEMREGRSEAAAPLPPGRLSRRAVVGRGARLRLRQTPNGTECRRPSRSSRLGCGGARPGDGIGSSRLPESSSVYCANIECVGTHTHI